MVVNGITVFDTILNSNTFTDNLPTVFQNKLILGLSQEVFQNSNNDIRQSEASVTNVNVFSVPLNISYMIDATSFDGQCMTGDIVSWSDSKWEYAGNVEEVRDEELCKNSSFSHLFKMADGFHSWIDCMQVCPRIRADGRVPLTMSVTEAHLLASQFPGHWFWAPFSYQSAGNFSDFYTGVAMPSSLWLPGQPDGGLHQQCTDWKKSSADGKVLDDGCSFTASKTGCICHFEMAPLLRLRGLCKKSKIDNHLAMKFINGSIVFMGITGTMIHFSPSLLVPKWTLTVNLMKTAASTSAEETSFVLGKHSWSIHGDSRQCFGGDPYTKDLKMSRCRDGEFTCSSGDCISMEERCDQVLNCKDQTDELGTTNAVDRRKLDYKNPPSLCKNITHSDGH